MLNSFISDIQTSFVKFESAFEFVFLDKYLRSLGLYTTADWTDGAR